MSSCLGTDCAEYLSYTYLEHIMNQTYDKSKTCKPSFPLSFGLRWGRGPVLNDMTARFNHKEPGRPHLYYEAIPILKLKYKKSNYRTRSKELQSKHTHTHTKKIVTNTQLKHRRKTGYGLYNRIINELYY